MGVLGPFGNGEDLDLIAEAALAMDPPPILAGSAGLASAISRQLLGLRDKFDSIKCADDVENVKPEPDLYLAVLEGLGLRPEEAIALEDSPNGITSAQAAGLFCVVVPNPLTRQLPTDHADLRLDSLAGLSLESLLALAERKHGNRQDRPRLP